MRISDWSSDVCSSDLLAHRITDPRHKLRKTYLVQVEGMPDDAQLQALREGVELNDGRTRPALARLLETPPPLWPRDPPVRFRKTVADAWLELVIAEGRNRQVRRMTAAVGLPRSEEHTSELQSLMRISYAVFCLK